jgi:hypothetical protein
MAPKALKTSAAIAFVVFAVFATLLCTMLSRNAATMTGSTGHGSGARSIKPILVGVGAN